MTTKTGPTRVRWWIGRGPSTDDFRRLFVEPWHRQQERVRVELESVDSDARNRTVAALEAGTGPDLVMIPRAGDFVSLARQGLFMDLTRYARSYRWADRLLAPAMTLGAVAGRLFGIPRSSETMALLTNEAVTEAPVSLAGLERAAADAQRDGLLPFGSGCADYPETSELLWTLVVNHYAGPAAVRAALAGELAWTAPVFVEAIDLLRGWFARGWFGDDYFEQTIEAGLRLLTSGQAAMSPVMTGMLPHQSQGVGVAAFPVLRPALTPPLYIFGTASLLGINARSVVADDAAEVLDAVLQPRTRRIFSAHAPGDWNIPLADPDDEALTRLAPRIFAGPAIGLTNAVNAGQHGYASWSYLPPPAERLVVEQFRPLAEGRLGARQHLSELQDAMHQEVALRSRCPR